MEREPVELFGRLRHPKHVVHQRAELSVAQVSQREKPKSCEAGALQGVGQWPL